MTYPEAIALRQQQLQGKSIPAELLRQAMKVLAAKDAAPKRRTRRYRMTAAQVRAIDKAQIRLLKAELGERL